MKPVQTFFKHPLRLAGKGYPRHNPRFGLFGGFLRLSAAWGFQTGPQSSARAGVKCLTAYHPLPVESAGGLV